MEASVDHLDWRDFEQAQPMRAAPGVLAALICGALSCLATGALIGLYFGMNQVALF
jgi:hypothetical protein